MFIKISTLLNKIFLLLCIENAIIIMDFYNYMQEKDGSSSENHKVNNIRVVIDYAKYLENTAYMI